MLKKIVSTIMSVVLAFGLAPLPAYADIAVAAPQRQDSHALLPQATTISLQDLTQAYISHVQAAMANDPRFPATGTVELAYLPVKFSGANPLMGWVYRVDGEITEYEFYFDDTYILKTAYQELVKKYDPGTLVNVKAFGATGDGVTDDTEAIAQATKQIGETGGILYFPLGTYLVSPSGGNGGSGVTVHSKQHVEVDFMKSTVQMKTNSFQAYATVHVKYCANAEIRNGVVRGDRLTHDYETTKSTHEWGKGVQSSDNASCSILNMDISNVTGDAIYVRSHEKGSTSISDCSLSRCRRQGISVTACDVVDIRNTDITLIGHSDDVKGTSPMAGIDLEPNSFDDVIQTVRLDNVKCGGNSGPGLVQENKYSSAVKDVYLENSSIERLAIKNGGHIKNCRLIYPADNPEQIKNSTIEHSYIGTKGKLLLTDVTMDHCTFEGVDLRGSGSGVSLRLVPTRVTATNNTFVNVQGSGYRNYSTGSIASTGISLTDLKTDSRDDSYSFNEGSGNNTYDGCSVIIDNLKETGSTFRNCFVFRSEINKGEVEARSMTFEDCLIRSQNCPTAFVDCTFKVKANPNIGASDPQYPFIGASRTRMSFQGCFLEFEGKVIQKWFPNSLAFDASTLYVKDDISDDAFKKASFANESKILVGECTGNRELPRLSIPNSTEGADYAIGRLHRWTDPTYTWNDGKTSCTATRLCSNDLSHVESETADVEISYPAPATYRMPGLRRSTAQFESRGFATQVAEVAVPALEPIPVQVTGIQALDKVYDGTAAAILDFSHVRIATHGGYPEDELAVSARGVFENPVAGSGKKVFIESLALVDDYDGKYALVAGSQQDFAVASIRRACNTLSVATGTVNIRAGESTKIGALVTGGEGLLTFSIVGNASGCTLGSTNGEFKAGNAKCSVRVSVTASGDANHEPGSADIVVSVSGSPEGSPFDGNAFEAGAPIAATEKAISALAGDNDPEGTEFGPLALAWSKAAKNSVKLKWSKVRGAKAYVLYGASCGKATTMKKIATTAKASLNVTKIGGKKLSRGTYYKFMAVAVDKAGRVVSSSKLVHIATSGGKACNYRKVTTKAANGKLSMKPKKTFKLNAKGVKASKKQKVKSGSYRKLAYETSNPKIATVNSKGVVKGVKKGTCYVYAYTYDGTYAKVKVKVR